MSQEAEQSFEAGSLIDQLEVLDEDLFEEVAEWHAPILDDVLPRLSLAASYSRLWMGVAAIIALFGGKRGRQIALAGMAGIGITSAAANIAFKGMTRRRRPSSPVPEGRRLELPDSSSFPSGHTASAAAFSGVVGAEIPVLRAPLNGLAAAVGFSRVYTGVHYPGDVLAGWILGKVVATVVARVFRRVTASD